MESEQRTYPRAPLSGTVKFYDWDRPFQAGAEQISASGVFLRTASQLAEGSLVTMRLAIPGLSRAFTVLGRVVRTVRGSLLRAPGLGIRFVDITDTDRRSILEYVARRVRGAA
ncbi:MAG: PilZ domain-containing protein [Myxococcaceae bacterium]